MYYVYKVFFEEYNAIYIGCTSDITRRRHQHNENARKGKSFFGNFIKSHNIILKDGDMNIISEFESRKEALAFERQTAMSMNGTGVFLLNDLYSDHCSKVGLSGKDNPTSKVYAIIDMEKHSFEIVDDMHGWCNMHEEVSYKTLIGTSKRKPHAHKNRYIVREIDEWNTINEKGKEDLISGKWYAEHLAQYRAEKIKTSSKTYLVQTPNGEIIKVKNLDKFARDNGINAGNLHASLSNCTRASGYKVLKKLS